MPPLRGIDTTAGIARIAGNTDAYRKILLKFASHNADSAKHISDALRLEEYDQAGGMVHAIRGAGGNIGADELYRAAGDLEGAIRQKETGSIETLMVNFASSLSEVLSAIDTLDQGTVDSADGDKPDSAPPVPINPSEIEPILVKLAEAIEDDISEASEQVAVLRELLSGSGMMQEVGGIETGISAYDTDGALDNLSQLAGRLNIQIGKD